MRSIKVALATGVVVATTIGGAYAAGAVNKHGHEVDGRAAKGQSVAAAARADHGRSANAGEHATSAPKGPATTPATDEPANPSTGPTAKGEHGHHYGRVKAHRQYGHHWGRGHGTGAVVKPDNPNKPVKPTTSRN